ncbi:Eco57I restriction-modification methylase domain-containing protein [Promethearchaeum syntrophicum]|uniref:site-specific DNA-methyltransferase (adenine-specific) n=1 Tax=Promethearchaeum syntrophicum TaxID=2594042 RepID=A0A5B9DA62_9ARCH|nr:Eco57I restriction-modification methylase domain-containing protein [Candidatus Prometheoarchaeum syntrophicum]QEE15881.1 Eco57I restriction-modification methylase [Candidatus Prometheoarchaeum syntrophicum]
MNPNHEILETEETLDRLIYGFKELIKDKNKDNFQFKGRLWKLSLKEAKINAECNLITPKTLEKIFESVGNNKSNNSGIIFTPSWITDTMVDYTFDQWLFLELNGYFSNDFLKKKPKSLDQLLRRMLNNDEKFDYQSFTNILFKKAMKKVKILDPCVGGGAFITSLIQKICKIFTLYFIRNNNIDTDIDTEIFNKSIKILIFSYSEEIRTDIISEICNFIKENLYFADLNNYSLEITKIRIKCILITLFSRKYSHLIDKITFHSYLGNTLTNFGKDFPLKFHIIFGNPPYISSDNIKKNISKKTLNELKENYSLVIKKGSKPDLYFYFLKRAVDHLEYKGFLSFIIPNRVLSNDYALKLRVFLLKQCKIQLIVDFNPKIQIFPRANVHPCILTISKQGRLDINEKVEQDHLYYSALIKKNSILQNFNINTIEKQKISQDLSYMYNIFFTELSEEMQNFLISVNKFPRLKKILKIHEGTRIARFKHKIPDSTPIRITSEQWSELSEIKKSEYIGEIRGKDITRYHIGKHRQYITLPELLDQSRNSLKKTEIIAYMSETTLYFRELGKKLYAGLKFGSNLPSIAYGGVYFFKESDIQFSAFKIYPAKGNLPAFLTYLSSNIVLNIYRALYSSSAWGDALKFRSNYFYRIPLIPFDIELFTFFGLLLTNIKMDSSPKFIQNQEFLIRWIENAVSICLLGSVIFNSEEFSIIEEKNLKSSDFSKFINDIKIIFKKHVSISRLTFSSENYDVEFLFDVCTDMFHSIEEMQSYSQVYAKIKESCWYKALF